MKRLIKKILSQKFINNFYHMPKAILANIIYGFPTKKLKVIGVTGTDGKTTTVNMIYQILKADGKKVSMISTISAIVGGKIYDTGFHVTSPNPFLIQKLARQAVLARDEFLVLEVTSHAIDQYRFWGVKFDVGVITNITHEHLDYHKSFENYFQTKLKLIRKIRFAVLNQALKAFREFREFREVGEKIITFGLDKGDFNQKEVKTRLKIPGDYNIENALAAYAVAFVLNIDKEVARKTLENFEGVVGRMEEIRNKREIRVFIDFAHTPNGLDQALRSLQSFKTGSGKLISIIGAEGERDVEKRPMIGKLAKDWSDIVVVTAQDPRAQLDMIDRQIFEGAKGVGAKQNINYFVIDDRSEAINFAINKLARKGDVIGIFGKGHETSMNLDGKNEVPWSDREAVENALKDNRGDLGK